MPPSPPHPFQTNGLNLANFYTHPNPKAVLDTLDGLPETNPVRAHAKESQKMSRKDKSPRKRWDAGGGDNSDLDDGAGNNSDLDDGASFSSGSTYYVVPSPNKTVNVLLYCLTLAVRHSDLSNFCFPFPKQPTPSMWGLYAAPTSSSKSTPILQSQHSPNRPYSPSLLVPPQRPQK